MWSRSTCGKWLPRESVKRMSESASEAGEVTGNAFFQVGDSITAFTYPLTEGLIIARNFTEESKLELTIIVALFKKRGRNWSRASVVTRDAARLSKKMPTSFTFPIKNVEVLRLEAKNAKGDSAWAFATCVALDRYFCQTSYGSGASESEIHEEKESLQKENRDATKKLGAADADSEEKRQDLLNARVEEVMKLRDKNFPRNTTTKERRKNSESDSLTTQKIRSHERMRGQGKRRRPL